MSVLMIFLIGCSSNETGSVGNQQTYTSAEDNSESKFNIFNSKDKLDKESQNDINKIFQNNLERQVAKKALDFQIIMRDGSIEEIVETYSPKQKEIFEKRFKEDPERMEKGLEILKKTFYDFDENPLKIEILEFKEVKDNKYSIKSRKGKSISEIYILKIGDTYYLDDDD